MHPKQFIVIDTDSQEVYSSNTKHQAMTVCAAHNVASCAFDSESLPTILSDTHRAHDEGQCPCAAECAFADHCWAGGVEADTHPPSGQKRFSIIDPHSGAICTTPFKGEAKLLRRDATEALREMLGKRVKSQVSVWQSSLSNASEN